MASSPQTSPSEFVERTDTCIINPDGVGDERRSSSYFSNTSFPNKPSILPKRDSLPPPLRPKSASSRSSLSLSPVLLQDNRVIHDYQRPANSSSNPNLRQDGEGANQSYEGYLQERDKSVNDELEQQEKNRTNTIAKLAGDIRPLSVHGPQDSDLDQIEMTTLANGQIPKKTKTPMNFIQDHMSVKTPKLPIPLTATKIPIPIPIPTHINLPTPIMPLIHLSLLVIHLIFSALVPFLLFKNMIQPLVLWIITTVTVVLQCVYLLPGIFLEAIGLLRRRPIVTAWLQSGLHIVIMILSLIPHSATVFLLIKSDQIPSCSSVLFYKPPEIPNFESHLRWSTCKELPKVTRIALVNVVIVCIEIIVASVAVSVDYKIQRIEEKRHSVDLLAEIAKVRKKRRRKTWWKERPDDTVYGKIRRRRWTVGTGKLLWDIEGYIQRKKAKQTEDKSV
ncbi:uncharacterized protein I206_106071 [Kwoniella pini CBS 10737]|uniref:Uncharacterized protein n=1 Tax=Kwoniella pini CBS 10737 TaxID=1296096 RepID=A0A1B9I0Z0_9TREE|nr:uncharacterized protein I206_04894 [Kwoniella pini CBS 10737]OCF49206.1 hypothetical protein I206_04894 [Kwoniella pini CBS 10737]